MGRLSVLLLAPDANPESVCGPLIGYSQAQALARLHDVALVVRSACEPALRQKQGALHSVEVFPVRMGKVARGVETHGDAGRAFAETSVRLREHVQRVGGWVAVLVLGTNCGRSSVSFTLPV